MGWIKKKLKQAGKKLKKFFKSDVGKVIGKKGRNVNAIRTLLSASNAKEGGKRAILEIIE